MKFFILLLLVSGQFFDQVLSIKEQARNIISKLKSSNEFPIDAKDTLIDLNGDGFKDLLIEYYGACGTGRWGLMKLSITLKHLIGQKKY